MNRLVRRRVRVSGQVQGVWFRGSTREEALRRGVAGWVCNHRNGSVEAVFEGDVEAVNALLEFCALGPAGARVAQVAVSDEAPRGLSGFQVEAGPPAGESAT